MASGRDHVDDRPIVRGGNMLPPSLSLPAGSGATSTVRIAARIDHTLLRPNAVAREIERLCEEAMTHGFAAVCVNPVWVPACAASLRGSRVRVCAVVGFPLGAMRSPIKALEAERARAGGAHEIDMVMNVGELKSDHPRAVHDDVLAVRRAVGSGVTLKVILETGLLAADEKALAAGLAVEAGADYVKTSTGFGPGGATEDDVRLLVRTVGDRARVKASGGIRTLEIARRMIEAGADRLGTSSGVAIANAEA